MPGSRKIKLAVGDRWPPVVVEETSPTTGERIDYKEVVDHDVLSDQDSDKGKTNG